ncbi:hypothetical protein [Streptomyces collinus]|uniref:hypothetical protein n=1 Tax=Streptomyces collinus TaxID=42684 RepID=UPI0036F17FC7
MVGVPEPEHITQEPAYFAGHRLAGIELPAGTVVATVVREGRPTVPGDELLLVSHEATEQEIHAAFQ